MDARLIGLKIGNDFVNCETAVVLQFNNEMLNTSSSVNGNWEHSRIGYKGWTVTVDGKLVVSSLGGSFNSLLNAYLNNELLSIAIANRDFNGNDIAIWGNAYIAQGQLEAGNTGKAGWQIQFKGVGALNADFELFFNIINAMPSPADKDIVFVT